MNRSFDPLSQTGLSPRVRGNPSGGTCTGISVGSIPACAGEPSPVASDDPDDPVYPRVCGGTHIVRSQAAVFGGLSPRVRGNRAAA